MGLTVTFDDSKNQIKANLTRSMAKHIPAVESYMLQRARELQQYMKDNRPWQDRTGNARAGLYGRVSRSTKGYRQTIELGHSVYYGVYLEYAMERRFAIIEPTIRIKGPEVVNGLQDKIGLFIETKEVRR